MIIKKLESYSIFSEEDKGKNGKREKKEKKEKKKKKFKISDIFAGIGAASFNLANIDKGKSSNPKSLFSDINEIGEKYNTIVQIFDFNKIISQEHILYAIYFANRAFLKGINISNNLGMEYLLYSSQQRQIDIALNIMGFKLDTNLEQQKFAYAITGYNEKYINSSQKELSELFKSIEIEEEWIKNSIDRINMAIKAFNISDFEIKNSLITLDPKYEIENINKSDSKYQVAILRCITERMALLSLENK
ncbi:MAG: hypothetical protein GY870_07795 [archaeon]|nr:hypothetical protein [archaeon]